MALRAPVIEIRCDGPGDDQITNEFTVVMFDGDVQTPLTFTLAGARALRDAFDAIPELDPHVSPRRYPAIYEAFNEICRDNNLPRREFYKIPERYVAYLHGIEVAIKELPAEERQMFIVGDFDDQLDIANRSSDLRRAHELLNDFFNEEA